jgi:hypothetical protein
VRDWVLRFNARGPDGLLDGKAPGPRSRLNDAQRRALADIVERGPIPAIHGVVRWRLIDLEEAPKNLWRCMRCHDSIFVAGELIPGLPRQRQSVRTVDHRFALGNSPALPSAPARAVSTRTESLGIPFRLPM